MTARLYLLDPEPAPAWAPFLGARPIGTLRTGPQTIADRWCDATGATEAHLVSDTCPKGDFPIFVTGTSMSVIPTGPITGPAVLARADHLPIGTVATEADVVTALTTDEGVAGWVVPAGVSFSGGPAAAEQTVETLRLRGAFDVVTALERLLSDDLSSMLTGAVHVPAGVTVLGDPSHLAARDADIEPGAVLDVRDGPIVLEAGTSVRSDSRLAGPLWIGPGTRVLGGAIGRSAIGPRCKVRGEMTDTVMFGLANKSHDGFVGHSVIGEWANLGAATVTSNLKNTYGDVRLQVDGADVETRRTFLGAIIGDHVKTAIGTLLGTGTVVGCGANVFGANRPSTYIHPFAWGTEGGMTTREGFLTVAERVLARRNVSVDHAVRTYLDGLYSRFGSA